MMYQIKEIWNLSIISNKAKQFIISLIWNISWIWNEENKAIYG